MIFESIFWWTNVKIKCVFNESCVPDWLDAGDRPAADEQDHGASGFPGCKYFKYLNIGQTTQTQQSRPLPSAEIRLRLSCKYSLCWVCCGHFKFSYSNKKKVKTLSHFHLSLYSSRDMTNMDSGETRVRANSYWSLCWKTRSRLQEVTLLCLLKVRRFSNSVWREFSELWRVCDLPGGLFWLWSLVLCECEVRCVSVFEVDAGAEDGQQLLLVLLDVPLQDLLTGAQQTLERLHVDHCDTHTHPSSSSSSSSDCFILMLKHCLEKCKSERIAV